MWVWAADLWSVGGRVNRAPWAVSSLDVDAGLVGEGEVRAGHGPDCMVLHRLSQMAPV